MESGQRTLETSKWQHFTPPSEIVICNVKSGLLKNFKDTAKIQG